MLNRVNLISALLVVVISGPACAQAPLDVSNISDLQSLTPNIAYLRYNQDEEFTAEEVLAGSAGEFQAIPGQDVSFGYSSDQFWFAIDTINSASEPIDLLLDTNIKFLSPLIIHEIDAAGVRRELLINDEYQPFANRPINTPRLTVPVSWEADEQKLLLVYARSGSGMDLRLQIGSAENVLAKYATRLTFYSFFGGVLLSLILINLFYYYAVRRVAHLLYAFQEMSILLFMMHIDGFAFQYLWPESPTWNAHATMFFGHIIIIASSLFSISFLELRRRAPIFYRLGQAIGVVGTIMLLLTPWIEPQLSHQVGLITTAVGSVIFFAAGCLVSLGGHRPARYFVTGWLFMSLGAVVYGFANLGFFALPIDSLLVLRLGVLLEGLLLSYGLSDQLKVLQERATLAHENLLRSTEQRLEEAIQHVEIEQENARTKEEMLRKDLDIARASHDIRQPISSLRMALLGLLRNQKDPSTAEVFNRTLDHMEKLLGDRISGAASEALAGARTYGEFIDQTVGEFAGQAVAQGMELRRVGCSLPLTEPQIPLKRVLNNLLVNALRHSNGSRVLLGVRRRPHRIELMVIDDGKGDFEAESDNPGTGLGLGIVRELCKDNDWLFDVRSIHGLGTSFMIGITR